MTNEHDFEDHIYDEDEQITKWFLILCFACNPAMWIIVPLIMLSNWIGLRIELRRRRNEHE